MDELWDINNANVEQKSNVFSKPTFPTRRWGKTFTKNSTNDKQVIERLISKLKEQGKVVRKRLCQESMEKFKKHGNFYKIEIKND